MLVTQGRTKTLAIRRGLKTLGFRDLVGFQMVSGFDGLLLVKN